MDIPMESTLANNNDPSHPASSLQIPMKSDLNGGEGMPADVTATDSSPAVVAMAAKPVEEAATTAPQQPPSPSEKKEEVLPSIRKSPEKTPRQSSLNGRGGMGNRSSMGASEAVDPSTAVEMAPTSSAAMTTAPPPVKAPKKKSHASKTLKTLEKYKQTAAVTQFLSLGLSQNSQQPNQLESTSSAININYNQRISVPGTILEIANRITDADSTPLGTPTPDDYPSSSSNTNTLLFTQKEPLPSSSTMAPSMSFPEENLDHSVYDSFVPRERKKKRIRDATTGTTEEKKKKKRRSSGGTTHSTSKSSEPSENTKPSYRHIRLLPDPTPKPKQYEIVSDSNPHRIHNPLLELPLIPSEMAMKNTNNGISLEEIPTGGELWNVTNLVFAESDTYPIGYLGRILGFDLPSDGRDEKFGQEFHVEKLVVPRNDDENILDIPTRGEFVNTIWKQPTTSTLGEDGILSYMDPLYIDILRTYRGYNEDDFKDAGKGYLVHLSPLVLEFAKERGLMNSSSGDGDNVKFRMATMEDESTLLALEKKCQCRCPRRQDLGTNLKTPGTYCIIAESTEKVPLAFILYRFCWYKVEEKKVGTNSMTSYGVKSRAGEAVDKVSELVFFIDNVIYDDGSTDNIEEVGTDTNKHLDVETTRVLLVSLALIHAWSHNIWYGMMEAPYALVPFYQKYFRMVTVGKQKVSAEDDKAIVPLVCDLKKCSFRYAIHLCEERLKSSQQPNPPDDDQGVNERMLVHMSTGVDAIKTLQKPSDILFSSANSKKSDMKQVHIRMSTAHEDQSVPDILSVTKVEGEEVTTKVDTTSLKDSPVNWDVFKCFSTESKPHLSGDTSGIENDFFLAELIKKQEELKSLELSIEQTSRDLLGKAYNDALDFHLGDRKAKKDREKQILKEFEAVKQRLHEADLAWQAQLEQDMDAVCDICWDGEVTPENQIIFCDACNVAVHQGCYGIDKVPSGNYFCHPCIHNGKDNEFLAAERREGPRSALTRTPIICELCPRRQGAFVQTETAADSLRKPRWVHVGCAKWSGLNYVDVEKRDMIEDVASLKAQYQSLGITCALCKSGIGAMHQCRVEGCNKWLHLTCARCVGTCSVQHGENCDGPYPEDSIPYRAWTLACLEHSDVDPDSIRKNSITVEQLVAIAKSYPPEPVPPKPFNKMNGKERREYWADSDNLEAFVKKVQSIKASAFCAVCEVSNCDEQCEICGIYFHKGCVGANGKCYGCEYTAEEAESANYKAPICKMCNDRQGPVLKTYAKPVTMKKWKKGKGNINKSLFGPNNFCHVLCGFWNPQCQTVEEGDSTVVDTSQIVMGHGFGFVFENHLCILCGHNSGAKVQCTFENYPNQKYFEKCAGGRMHVTCARAAGFEVKHVDADTDNDESGFLIRCFHHSENATNLRARLEDLLEVEIDRSSCKSGPKKFDKGHAPMTWDHAASLFHSAVVVLRVMGWAWRWAEWWVAEGDNWEPLLEEGQVEENMTDEELKKVPSTPESRCEDARRCRLAAFGAALRNRDYDKVEAGDQQPLERALRAVLSTPSLVGPLRKKEIEFYIQWLSVAYRSKSPLLGFGDNKIPVANKDACLHIADQSPKYELGNRSLPGMREPEHAKTIFEPKVEEPDDFLKYQKRLETKVPYK